MTQLSPSTRSPMYRYARPYAVDQNVAGLKAICRDVLNAHIDGSALLGRREQATIEDIERGRYAMVADQRLRQVLRDHPNPAHRERYLAQIRHELGMDRASTQDAAAIGDLETTLQAPHDVAWSRFERLMSRGITCRASAELALGTACAHAAALAAQISFLIPLLGQ